MHTSIGAVTEADSQRPLRLAGCIIFQRYSHQTHVSPRAGRDAGGWISLLIRLRALVPSHGSRRRVSLPDAFSLPSPGWGTSGCKRSILLADLGSQKALTLRGSRLPHQNRYWYALEDDVWRHRWPTWRWSLLCPGCAGTWGPPALPKAPFWLAKLFSDV